MVPNVVPKIVAIYGIFRRFYDMRSPFLLFKRTLSGGKKAYYAKFWNEKTQSYSLKKSIASIKQELGRTARNYSHTSKAGAIALVQIWLDSNEPYLSKDSVGQYLSEFWSEESEYIKGKRRREESISSEYIKINASGINNYVKPFLESRKAYNTPLSDLTPAIFEDLMAYLSDHSGLGNSRINAIYKSISVPFSEAVRLGKLKDSPLRVIKKMSEKKVVRDILKPEQVKSFFSLISDSPVHYGINMLAATTGMRLGECRGLLHENVHEGWIDVTTNWQDTETHGNQLKDPKWGSVRTVPIPKKTYEALQYLIANNPYGNNFVFFGSKPDLPIGKKTVEEHFNKSVEAILKIDHEERKNRKITFHGWRHFFNTMLRGNIPDHALRELTGHRNEEMTDRYSKITEEQKIAVARLADDLV